MGGEGKTERIGKIGARGDKDMLRFQIPMEDSPRVAIFHSTDELSHDLSDLRKREVRRDRRRGMSDLILLNGIVPDTV
jgi:hypothetical protein